MTTRATRVLCLLALGAFSAAARLADVVTIVYDVPAREFRCWFDGPPPLPIPLSPCSLDGDHPVMEGVYFYRGQTVRLLLLGAVAADLFALDLKVDDLAEPPTPIYGGLTELPKLSSLVPVPSVVTTTTVTPAAGAELRISDALYRILSQADESTFNGFLKDNLLGPAGSKDLLRVLSADVETDIRALDDWVPRLQQSAHDIKDLLSKLPTNSLVKSYVEASPAGASLPDFDSLLDVMRRLSALLDRQRALRESINASGIAAQGKTVAELLKSATDPQFKVVLAIHMGDLQQFIQDFRAAFPPERRRSEINSVDLDKTAARFVYMLPSASGPQKAFLAKVNERLGPAGASDNSLKQLKKNLLSLADQWFDIETAKDRIDGFQKAASELQKYKDRGESVFSFQKDLIDLAVASIRAAATVNAIARRMPLPDKYRQPVVGEWYGSKEIVVTVKQGGRFPLFDVSGVSETARVAVTGGETPAAKAAQTPASEVAAVRQLRFRIHNLYHLQLAAGFVYARTRDDRYQVFTQTVKVEGKDETQRFIGQIRSRDYNILSTIELLIHPWARDYFPWKPRFAGERRAPLYKDFAPLVGFSITSPNRDFLVGGAWLPRQPAVGVKAGLHIALRDQPPEGVPINTPVTQPVAVLSQKVHYGPFVGLTFSTQLFREIFGLIFKQ